MICRWREKSDPSHNAAAPDIQMPTSIFRSNHPVPSGFHDHF
jgi:hypothetical protein